MKRLLKFFFSFLILSFILAPQTKAADLNIDCPTLPAGCSKTGLDPHFFSIATDGYWYPGKSITKTLNLKNSDSETREMAIRGTRTSDFSILENVMQISIVGGTTVIWSGSVTDFYGQDKIGMGIFAPGADLDYDFTVSMSFAADDNYQNKETVFDLTLGFWVEPVSTPTPTPTSAPGGGGGGTVLGASVSAPVCSDIAPASAPVLTSAVAGTNSVTLFWNEANGPLTYYLIAFGTQSGVPLYGNPNIGGAGTTSYTVTNLSAGQLYYFKVRAGNGCMPGPFSSELSSVPLGTTLAVGVPPGFQEGVLGVETGKEGAPGELGGGTATGSGEVEGEAIGKFSKLPLILGGLVLILILIVVISFFRRKK